MKTLLEVKNLCKTYATDGTQNHVLSNVNLTVKEGEFIGIMGASGSGKSTLLYCLSGMTRATSGEVFYGGADICKMKEKELTKLRVGDFGFVFQQMNLVPNLTMRENVAVPGYLNKSEKKSSVDQRAGELLSAVGIAEVADHTPSGTSGGQQQRCAIARGLINAPKILFADEPTGALNRSASKDVLNLLTHFNNEGQTIFLVTHDTKTAVRSSRLLYIEDGNIKGELTFPPYTESEEKAREAQLNAWLTSLNW